MLMKLISSTILLIALLLPVPSVVLAETGMVSGTVAESIDAGGYIFLRLEEQDMWIATSPFSVSEGDQVRFSGGAEMKNFYSKSLDRTFESIFFVQNVSTADPENSDIPQGSMQGHGAVGFPGPGSVQPPAPGELSQLKDGKTIANIISESDQLNGQAVSLRARVMKVSRNIMGKNWITLQDGTGTEPDNSLMTTSSELVSPGDLVVVRGALKKDVDIGSGYKYKVLLEQASFSLDLGI